MFGCKCYVLRNQFENLGKFEAKADEAIFVGYSNGKSFRVYNLRTNIGMKSIHVVFDDKKIQGLSDEGFHDNLRFENEGEGDLYDNDDDCDVHVQNAGVNLGINIPTDEHSMDETTAIENSARASVETPLDSSVEIISQNSNQFRNNEMSD